jgi:hypothetical protein
VCLFGGVELVELRCGATEPDLVCRGVDEVEGNKPASPVLGFDDEMGDRADDGINDHAARLATGPIATAGLSPDRELRHLCHIHPFLFFEQWRYQPLPAPAPAPLGAGRGSLRVFRRQRGRVAV